MLVMDILPSNELQYVYLPTLDKLTKWLAQV